MAERLPETLSEASRQRRKRQSHRRGEQFIRGPIRMGWICRAAQLPGKPVVVALALVFKAGVLKRKKDLPVTPHLLERFGVSRLAGYRALRKLERAKLVKVKRHRGRAPRVTILKGPKQ